MKVQTQTLNRAQKAIDAAIKEAGGASALARKIEAVQKKPISPQAVAKWVTYKSGCPSDRVLQVEALQSKCTRHDLRPDLYPK
jgi:DNA-binding transcriptional regulator YdaS (Cro superfamily)